MMVRSKHFFDQLPAYGRNQSAKQFDLLAAQLGFVSNDPRGLAIHFDPEAALAYRNIERSLEQFLQSQTIKTSGPLDAPPAELRAYLEMNAVLIAAIQIHLLEQPVPQWDQTYEHMFDPNYPFPGFFNVRNFQELLLLSALEHNHRGQPVEMHAALEASWRLNQALLERPDLTAQVSVSAVSELQAGLLRHLDLVPDLWQARLVQQSHQQSVMGGRQFETWLQYNVQQQLLMSTVFSKERHVSWLGNLSSRFSYWFSPAYITQLKGIETTQMTHQAIDLLRRLEVCSVTQYAAEQKLLRQARTVTRNPGTALGSEVLARRWKIEGDRELTLELTQQVLQAKQLYAQTGRWPKPSTKVVSEACPGEFWSYAYEDRSASPVEAAISNEQHNGQHNGHGVLTLSLSAEPLPTTYHPPLKPRPPVPFAYQFPVH